MLHLRFVAIETLLDLPKPSGDHPEIATFSTDLLPRKWCSMGFAVLSAEELWFLITKL